MHHIKSCLVAIHTEESSLNYKLYAAGLVVLLVCVASGVYILVARKPQSLISPAVVGEDTLAGML